MRLSVIDFDPFVATMVVGRALHQSRTPGTGPASVARRISMTLCTALLVTIAACSGGVSRSTVDELPVVTIETVIGTAVPGAPLEFAVQADPAPADDLTVSLTVTGCMLPAAPQAVVITAGQRVATLTVPTNGAEGTCTVTVTIVAGDGYRVGEDAGSAATAAVMSGTAERPLVTIEAANATVAKGNPVSLSLTATPLPASPVTVNLLWADPDSALGEAPATTVTIPTSGTAELSAPTDGVGSVTVTVGTGSGYLVGSPASATVAVTDTSTERSVPGTPGPPSLTAPNHCSLEVSWSKPNGTVTGYDVQYRGGTVATWKSWPHSGGRTSALIQDLVADTTYMVQVRGRNADGAGPWSASASTATDPVPTDLPQVGVFPERSPITEGESARFRISVEEPRCTDLSVNVQRTVRAGTSIHLRQNSPVTINKGSESNTLAINYCRRRSGRRRKDGGSGSHGGNRL